MTRPPPRHGRHGTVLTIGRALRAVLVIGLTTAALLGSGGQAGPSRPAQALDIGATQTQVAPDGWKPREATLRAADILRAVTDAGNQHIMGWGTLNPAPAPTERDWSTLDARVRLLEATSPRPVVTLCCAPDWMKGGAADTTDWARLEAAPLPEHYDDFAALAVEVAQRYPGVRHFVVWNELKGFIDTAANDWDIEAYTDFYNTVYRALKAHDPTLLVGGPYVPMDTWSARGAMSHPSAVGGAWGVVDQRALDAVEHWLEHAEGADFLAVDGHSSTKDRGLVTDPATANEKFAVLTRWLTARTTLPVWWMEVYADVDRAEDHTSRYRADVMLDAVLGIADAGGAAVFLWQPEGDPTFDSAALWTSTALPGGGVPLPLADSLASVRRAWARGETVQRRWDDRQLVLTVGGST